MGTYRRRTFLKHSAMVAASAAAGGVLGRAADASPFAPRQQSTSHAFFADAKKLEVIAHRGGNGQWPGETMYAMRQAVKFGADVLEMDVYLTKDVQKDGRPERGELVLMHDIEVGSTTEGNRKVYEYELAEVQRLNAGHNWSPDGDQSRPYRGRPDLKAERPNDLRVPTLREVFDEFPNMRMVVEMKRAPAGFSPAKKLCDLIREKRMQNKVLVASFWAPFMNDFRDLCPEVATSATISLGDIGKAIADLRGVLAGASSSSSGSHKLVALQVPHQLFKSRIALSLLERIKGHGVKLHAWTVNDLVDMNLMKTLGVDGIITDYPGPLRAVLDQSPQT